MQTLLAQADVGPTLVLWHAEWQQFHGGTFMKRHALGLHTMRDEHFGISVVEFMAAGAVVAGPSSAVQQHQEQSELSRSLLTTPLALLWTLLGPE